MQLAFHLVSLYRNFVTKTHHVHDALVAFLSLFELNTKIAVKWKTQNRLAFFYIDLYISNRVSNLNDNAIYVRKQNIINFVSLNFESMHSARSIQWIK